MTSIQLTLTGAQARAEVDGILTAGMVGVPVTITWDESWEGLMKTLVCRSDGCTRTILNVGNQTTVAPEVFRTERWAPNALYLGVEGRDAEGKLVIPTTFAYCGQILPGAVAEDAPSQGPENPVWAQILRIIGDMDALTTSRKESLVAAINEAAGQDSPQGTVTGTGAVSVAASYQLSDSGTQVPTGSWSSTIPAVASGQYLWTKITISQEDGPSASVYTVSGRTSGGTAGGVVSVNQMQPDDEGNVTLTAAQLGAVSITGGAMTGALSLVSPTAAAHGATKAYTDAQVRKAAPRNVLDNSDFRNPVNQRGASSYNAAHAYCIDRWKLNDYAGTGTLAVTASGVKLTPASGVAEISQKLERSASFTGKNMTFAVKILGASSPNILNVTFGTNHSSVEANGCTLIHWSNDFLIRVSSEKTIEWAALYEGTYTADTLPEYHPKGYAAELAECQRYFYQTSGELVLSGYITGSAKRLYVGIHLPEMRISPSLANPIPTMTVRTTAGYSPVANNTSPFGTPTAQAIAAFNRAGGDASMYFEFSDEIGTNNTPAVAQFRGSSYLAFSADL